jgi:hypothetical protein
METSSADSVTKSIPAKNLGTETMMGREIHLANSSARGIGTN